MSISTPRFLARRSKGLAAAGAVGAALVLFLLIQGQGSHAVQPAPTEIDGRLIVMPLGVRIEPGYAVRERYVGRASSQRESHLGFTQGGLLVEVLADEGDAVEADQVLARLDTARLRVARRELDAQVHEIEARLGLARLTLERTRTLADKNSVSTQQLDEARFEEMALAARLASARAGIERVDVDLGHAQLRAPFGGRIVARSADEGTILAPGQAVLQLIESGRMEARVGVPPAVADRLTPGTRYELELEGERVDGELTAVLDEVVADTRTVTVILRLDAASTPIRHGSLVRLTLETLRDARGFWLPISSLSESRRGLWAAFVLVPEPGSASLHRIERREVSLLHAESDRAFVRGTLGDGDQIVASGVDRLVPGQLVQLASPASLALGDSH